MPAMCHQGWDTEIAQKNLRSLSKHTNMTTHWKSLGEHFLMVHFVPLIRLGKMHFLNFSPKNISP
jgi:hypothetical protein